MGYTLPFFLPFQVLLHSNQDVKMIIWHYHFGEWTLALLGQLYQDVLSFDLCTSFFGSIYTSLNDYGAASSHFDFCACFEVFVWLRYRTCSISITCRGKSYILYYIHETRQCRCVHWAHRFIIISWLIHKWTRGMTSWKSLPVQSI